MAGRPPRRSWESLTPAYRRRLERSGITRAGYESGAPLTGARGHKSTPERPGRADRRPDYAAYRAQRSKPMRVVTPSDVVTLSGMTSADRSLVASHLNAVRWYLANGSVGSRLPDFENSTVTGYTFNDRGEASALTVTLDTDQADLSAKERDGELNFDSPYPKDT